MDLLHLDDSKLSRRHPEMIRSLADRIGGIGKLPVVEALEAVGDGPPDDGATGSNDEALVDSQVLQDAAVPSDGQVLLFDGTYRSG